MVRSVFGQRHQSQGHKQAPKNKEKVCYIDLTFLYNYTQLRKEQEI